MRTGWIALGVILGSASAGAAEVLSFESLWDQVRGRAPELESARHEAEAARIAADRAGRYFWPRLTLDGRAVSTNDAGSSLFSLLGQRSVQPSDFAPGALNRPGASFFQKGSLLLDLPLYQGGQGAAMSEAARQESESRRLARDAILRGSRAEAASQYAALLVARGEEERLSALSERLTRILSRYELGSRSNPVGYSGYLGLRSLRARLAGLLEKNRAEQKAIRTALSVRAGREARDWVPAGDSAQGFLSGVLGADEASASLALSVLAAQRAADASEAAAGAEKARFLPRVGAFAQGDMLHGERNTGASYSAGAYLQWELFSPTSWGSVSQGSLQAQAARSRAVAAAEEARIGSEQARESLPSIEANLGLLRESLELSDEQMRTADTLFRNGSINALQLVEVLSRRADLVLARSQAEMQWVQVRTRLHLVSGGTQGESR